MTTTTPAPELNVDDQAPARKQMLADVLDGLSKLPKELPPGYLYDARGSRLFDEICKQPEYYPTRTEAEILRDNMAEIAACIGPHALLFEPGCGSGVKTVILLAGLERLAGFVPMDIAREHLVEFAARVRKRFPKLPILPVCGDFHDEIDWPEVQGHVAHRVAFFPGSTIGNMLPEEAVQLLRRLADLAESGGGLLVGVDTKKDPARLEPAYDDAAGVSAAFALNYLDRLNRELGANFRKERFGYTAPYNEELGRIEMYIVSRQEQTVQVGQQAVKFAAGERIRTEWSYKYTPEQFIALAAQAGLRSERVWTDDEQLFSVHYLVVE